MTKSFLILGMACLVVCFQNCGEKSFSLRTDMNKSSVESSFDESDELVETETPEEVIVDRENDVISDNEQEVKPPAVKEPAKEEPKKEHVSCRDKNDGNARFVCILDGPGKSTHVAMASGQLASNNSTPKTVCMSEYACQKIIGAETKVKSVEQRGYCKKGSAQVYLLSDAEVSKLMTQ